MRKSVIPVILLMLALMLPALSLAGGKFPTPRGYVNDFAGVMDPASASELEGFLMDIESRTSAEVSVVTVPDIEGYADVDEYGVELFADWKIGKKGQDNGVLILVAPNEKKARIEVGYGLEGAITDGTAGAIIREVMAPYFKDGQYGPGLVAGAKAVAQLIPPGGVKKKSRKKGGFSLVLFVVFLILTLSQMFFPGARMHGRGRSNFGGGPFIGGFGGGFGGGGFGGGFGGGGGGFGGFGGGGSGGGGASGGW